VAVVAGTLACERGVQRMVPVVRPRGVEPVTAGVALAHESRVVDLRLRDEDHSPAQLCGKRLNLGRQLLEHVQRRPVVDRLDGVESQAVEVIVADPHQGVVDDEAPHFDSSPPVEVEGRAPARLAPLAQVRPELGEEVAHRAEVVVNDVEQDRQPRGMARIDQALQPRRAAI